MLFFVMLLLTQFSLLQYNTNMRIKRNKEIKTNNNCQKLVKLDNYLWLKETPLICEVNKKNKEADNKNINKKDYNLKDNVVKLNDIKKYKDIIKKIEVMWLLKNIKDYEKKWKITKKELKSLNNQKDLTKMANTNLSDFNYYLSLFKQYNDWRSKNPYIASILKRTVLDNWKLKFLTQKLTDKRLQKIQNRMLNDFLKITKTSDKQSNTISKKDFNKKYRNNNTKTKIKNKKK